MVTADDPDQYSIAGFGAPGAGPLAAVLIDTGGLLFIAGSALPTSARPGRVSSPLH